MVYFPQTVKDVVLEPEVQFNKAAALSLEFTWWWTEPTYFVASILKKIVDNYFSSNTENFFKILFSSTYIPE